tara:strand:- start:2089 stop:4023 length:1935 start_codon:yes stop_codon:yes gene_type:complete
MGIKRYIASADNTISNAYQMDLQTRGTGSNMGAADTLEVFYIYGQLSSSAGTTAEKSRILVQFDTAKIKQDRINGLIPISGNVAWYLNLYNAPHTFTLPKDFKVTVKVVEKSWQEGYGLDMENYTDQTYEGTGSNWARRGATGDGFAAWSDAGGDFTESTTSPAYSASFVDGTEDLSIDISHLVENWVDGNGVAATATGLLNGASGITDFDEKTFSLTDYEGTTVTFTFDKDVSSTGETIGLSGLSTTEAIRDKIVSSIDAVSSLKIDASNGATTSQFTLTMDAIGLAGNNIGGNGNFDASGATGHLSMFRQFQGGMDDTTTNYGLGVFLSSSFETGSHSYYTKKFFARSSEYFFLRPNLEARWDSSDKDSAANFVQSSSLATAEDNLNTLFLYNYVKGKLQNIPDNAQHSDTRTNMKVSLYSNSVGNVYDKLKLPKGGNVASANDTNAVGGIVSTGIYTASLAMSHSEGTAGFSGSVYAVWHYNDLVAYHTSSEITVNTINASNFNPDPEYVTTIDNLKPVYSRKEEARFRLFVREKDWNPNNYTVVQAEPVSSVIEDAYFSLYRTVDDYEIIPFGTGSAISPQASGSAGSYTRLSYDISGNYFDLDMSLLQAGYEYGLKFAYYSNGSYREQKEVFKFKVGEH